MTKRSGGGILTLHPLPDQWRLWLLRVALVGVHARAFSLANGNAVGSGLLCVPLVHFGVLTLENSGIRPIRKNGGKPGDILPGFQFFNTPCVHLDMQIELLRRR